MDDIFFNIKFLKTRKIGFLIKPIDINELLTKETNFKFKYSFDFNDDVNRHIKNITKSKIEIKTTVGCFELTSESEFLIDCHDIVFMKPMKAEYIKIMLDTIKMSIANNLGMFAILFEQQTGNNVFDVQPPVDTIIESVIISNDDSLKN